MCPERDRTFSDTMSDRLCCINVKDTPGRRGAMSFFVNYFFCPLATWRTRSDLLYFSAIGGGNMMFRILDM